MVRSSIHRVVFHRLPVPPYVIYTDAATLTRILAAVILAPQPFLAGEGADVCFAEISDVEWGRIFDQTTYIFGLEMIAAIAVLLSAGEFLRGRTSCSTLTTPTLGSLSSRLIWDGGYTQNDSDISDGIA